MQQSELSRPEPVLCVDLDGTLINSDLIWECVLTLVKSRPLLLLALPFWLLRGRPYLKRRLAEAAPLDVAELPYRAQVLEFVRAARQAGRSVALVTASDHHIAEQVSAHLGCFDQVLGTANGHNLKGQAKADLLIRLFGDHNFDYMGDSGADLYPWAKASGAYVVGSDRLVKSVSKVAPVKGTFPAAQPSFHTWIRALRGQHWAKNSLLFLPLLLAHEWRIRPFTIAALGFLAFGLCASGLYVMNDLLDLHSDRFHPWKKKRPFAAGEIPIWEGVLIAFVLLSVSLCGGFLLTRYFGLILAAYAVLTFFYSLFLKRIVLLDAFVLSGFYTIRIAAGGALAAVSLSQWFLAFSMFFFLSLAMAKRYSELVAASEVLPHAGSGRGYVAKDRELLLVLGVASSFSSVVVFTLYVHSQEVLKLYRRPEPLLLLTPLVLYWMSRVWLQAHRGELVDDPVTLALKDPVSYVVGAICVLIISLSAVLPA